MLCLCSLVLTKGKSLSLMALKSLSTSLRSQVSREAISGVVIDPLELSIMARGGFITGWTSTTSKPWGFYNENKILQSRIRFSGGKKANQNVRNESSWNYIEDLTRVVISYKLY